MVMQQNSSQISKSWERCTQDYHLDLGQNLKPERLTESELRLEQEAFNDQYHLATPIFERLFKQSAKYKYRVHASNAHGTLLIEDNIPTSAIPHSEYTLSVGNIIHEQELGTNGAGTCLATGEAITVHAKEHFSNIFHHTACSSAPLLSPYGEIAGTLTVSSHAQISKAQHQQALNLATHAATEIEATIFRAAYSEYHLISLVYQTQNRDELPHALLATNDSGWIIGATSSALATLGVKEASFIIGQGIDLILGYSLDALYKNVSLALYSSTNEETGWYIRLSQKDSWNISISHAIENQSKDDSPLRQIAGSDPHLKRNADICHKLIDKDVSILLMGETGTGKEVWARAIHDSSNRSDKPFITLNCAAIPESLIESELFGYSAGTFTGGLKKGKIGKIEASNGGTLFLDEIGDMPLELQARLLRVLAESEVTPLGQLEPIKVDFNVICATHRDIFQRVEDDLFREDLYYRISGLILKLSALRERSDRNDIIHKILKTMSDNNIHIDNYAMTILNKYHWPGNIRQLKNVLRFAVNMSDSKTIRITHLPQEVFNAKIAENKSEPIPVANTAEHTDNDLNNEKKHILHTLQQYRWVISHAAKALGMSRSTLHRKINIYNLK